MVRKLRTCIEKPKTHFVSARSLRRLTKIVFLSFLFCIGSNGQNTLPTAKINSLFQQFSSNTPGISVSLIEKDQVIYRKSFGNSQLEYNIPVSAKTPFHIASDSKRFTALAILLLEEQGKLKLSDRVQKYLPDLPDFGRTITIRHLLQHSSGLRDQWQLLGMAGWRMDDVVTQEHILKILYRQKELNFEPNDEFVYCNSGYTLLTEIVKRVSGVSFEEYTRVYIFEPLGMKDTHFHTDHQQIVKNRAYSYSNTKTESLFQKEILNFANAGATGLFTTVEDLEKWIFNVLSSKPKVGSEAIFKQMQEQLILNSGEKMIYGMGEMTFDYKGMKLIGHGGNDAGFNSFVGYFPEYDVGVIALSNWRDISSGNLVLQAAEIYLKTKVAKAEKSPKNEDISTGKIRKFITPEQERLGEQAGVYETVWGNVEVKVVDGGVFFKNVGKDEKFLSLKAESDTTYFNPDEQLTIVFSEKRDGVFNKLKVTGPNNTNFSAIRIYLIEYSSEDLKEFTGVFTSDELMTDYKIILEKDTLVAKHSRHSDISLSLKSKDRFTGGKWFFDIVEFTRDKNGAIDGLLLSGGRGRAKNVRFLKK